MTIEKVGGKWCVIWDSKVVKCWSSKAKALAQHAAIVLSEKRRAGETVPPPK